MSTLTTPGAKNQRCPPSRRRSVVSRTGTPPRWTTLTGARIRAARERLGLTQEQFGPYLGRKMRRGLYPSVRTISRWETDEKRVGPTYGTTLLAIVEEVERATP